MNPNAVIQRERHRGDKASAGNKEDISRSFHGYYANAGTSFIGRFIHLIRRWLRECFLQIKRLKAELKG